MKSINHITRLFSLITLLILIVPGFSSAQNTIVRERIIPVQAGTATIVNGKVNVSINTFVSSKLASSEAIYIVSLTPIGDCGQLKLSEKTNSQFSIQEIGNNAVSNHQFDYVVFLKENVTVEYPGGVDPAAATQTPSTR